MTPHRVGDEGGYYNIGVNKVSCACQDMINFISVYAYTDYYGNKDNFDKRRCI